MDVVTFIVSYNNPFLYFCFIQVIGEKAELALSPQIKQTYQKWIIHQHRYGYKVRGVGTFLDTCLNLGQFSHIVLNICIVISPEILILEIEPFNIVWDCLRPILRSVRICFSKKVYSHAGHGDSINLSNFPLASPIGTVHVPNSVRVRGQVIPNEP